jgi:hypothetical protein
MQSHHAALAAAAAADAAAAMVARLNAGGCRLKSVTQKMISILSE